MLRFIHIGRKKTISTNGMIGIFEKLSLEQSEENEGVFPDLFDEDEEEKFEDANSIFLFDDNFSVLSNIQSRTLIKRYYNQFEKIIKESGVNLGEINVRKKRV